MDILGSDITRRVSYNKKVAKDFERQKSIMDLYDTYMGEYRDEDRIRRTDVNYDLFNGRLDVNLYEDPLCLNLESEEVKFDFNNITHYPLISQVANAMHGEMITRPFRPMAKDIGSAAQTIRSKKWNELIMELLESEVMNPLREKITQDYMFRMGINDPYQLSPEEMQQMEADINNAVQKKTPDDIIEFISNEYQTPTQLQAQRLLDYFITHQDITYKQQEGFKHGIITGMEVYYIGDQHDEPILELVNNKYFTWGRSQNTEWIQDSTWAKYEQWRTLEDITQVYAEHFNRSNLRELEGFSEPIGGAKDKGPDAIQERVMYELSIENGVMQHRYADTNYKTRKGQGEIVNLYSDIIRKYGLAAGTNFANFGVRDTHIVWRDKRKMYKVKRAVKGKEMSFWQDEHYEPKSVDIEIKEVWVDEVWEGRKIGSTSNRDIYLNIRPIPGQYKSIFTPYGTKLPYVGREYNTHMNNAKNVSIIDLGKPWQKEFDTTMAQVKHDMATDLGNVFLMSLGMKPEAWKWQDWFDVMRNGKVLMTQAQKAGYGAVDPNALRSINLSKAGDIANKIQLLDYFRQNLVRAMNFNESRIGSIGQYTTNANIQQSQTASYNQTEGLFETHRKIVERALNMFMNRARILYKDKEKTKFILDDITRTELEISPEFWYEEWAIEFTTSSEDIRRVEELRAQMLSFVQNGMSFDGILALSLAKTPTDIVEVMKKENRRMEEERAAAAAQQQQQFEAQMAAQAADKQAEREFKQALELEKLASQERRTLIDVEKFAKAADIDGNKIADSLQRGEIDTLIKKQIEDAKLAAQKEMHKEKMEIERLKLSK